MPLMIPAVVALAFLPAVVFVTSAVLARNIGSDCKPMMPYDFTIQESGFKAEYHTSLTLAIPAGLLSYPYPTSAGCLLRGITLLQTCQSLLLLVGQISPSLLLLPPAECLRLHCPLVPCIHHR